MSTQNFVNLWIWAMSFQFLTGTIYGSITLLGNNSGVKQGPRQDKVMVHLFEWSWQDVARECVDLGRWGYWGVQVSPPQEDMLGNNWWTRYQPYSYNLLSRSGGLEDFKHMVDACRQHGVAIIVDVVINHMANAPPGSRGRAGSLAINKCQYPGLYECGDFHHFCGPSGEDACNSCCNCDERGCSYGGSDNIWHCNLGGLPDLDTSRENVRISIANYLNNLVRLGVAGVRIDAAKHIDPPHLKDILRRVEAPGLYVNQEIRLDGEDCNCLDYPRDYKPTGKIWEFKSHSAFYDALMHKNLPALDRLATGTPVGPCVFADTNDAVSFVVNHDFLTHAEDRTHTVTMFDEGLYSLALVVLLGHPYGQPSVLSSINFAPSTTDVMAPVKPDGGGNATLKEVYDRSTGEKIGCGYWKDANPDKPYLCEHAWPEVRNMVKFRSVAHLEDSSPVVEYINNGKAMALTYITPSRGDRLSWAFLFVNVDDSWWHGWVDTKGMERGLYCNVVGGSECWPCTQECKSIVNVNEVGWV